MKCLRFVLGGLLLSGAASAWGLEPYYDSGAAAYGDGHFVANGGFDYGQASGYGYGGCQSCSGLVPGCCDRPWSKYDHIWDGYCDEKHRHLGFQRSYTPRWLHAGPICTSGCGARTFALPRQPACTSCTSGYAAEQASDYTAPHEPPPQPLELDAPEPPTELTPADSPQTRKPSRSERSRSPL